MQKDLIFIGGGIAAALSVIEVCKKLEADGNRQKPVEITLIEKHADIWKGIPYGKRSSPNALIITSVHDFLNDSEKEPFHNWLLATKDEWASWYAANGGAIAARWLTANMPLIDAHKWQDVYIPRFLYGDYLHQKTQMIIAAASEKQLVSFCTVSGEAVSIRKENAVYTVAIETVGGTQEINAPKVVVSTGSSPMAHIVDNVPEGLLYVDDIYEPSVPATLELLNSRFSAAPQAANTANNLLIVGTNASSIELLYLLEGRPDITAAINNIYLLSSSGALPDHTNLQTIAHFPTPSLDELSATGTYDIVVLMEAAFNDLKLAKANGTCMDYVGAIVKKLLELLEPLGEATKKEFFGIHALRFRDSFRRAGAEYKSASDKLLTCGRATIVTGRFAVANPVEGGASVSYVTNGELHTLPEPVGAIINCTGSSNLDVSSSRLLVNLINDGLCTMNLSGKGFLVNEKFEAAPNLYIMGPLLGGNCNKLIHFWQLENASRLTYLAPFLAKELVETL
jgi:uncharacterized NAD(P)/FAD-binding protein YdhS